MTFKVEDVIKQYESISSNFHACEDDSCPRCVGADALEDSGVICGLMIQVILQPRLLPLLLYDIFQIGAALRDKEILEELATK